MSQDIVIEGVRPVRYIAIGPGSDQLIDGAIVDEVQACISVNGRELASYMCSPHDLAQLAHGFLFNEGLIDSLEDIHHTRLNDNHCVDIWLKRDFTPPERTIITAGCGGGITFADLSQRYEPLQTTFQVAPAELAELMRAMHGGALKYQAARGIHTAALADRDGILLQVEDIGRHNCLDRLRGQLLAEGRDSAGQVLLSSGRISSEMINKARRFAVPVVCSRTSPTSLSVALAKAWGITIVAYLRQERMRVYTHPERISGLGLTMEQL